MSYLLMVCCVLIVTQLQISNSKFGNGHRTNVTEDKRKAMHILSDELTQNNQHLNLPNASEEEENSIFICDYLVCASCQAVAFQFHTAFSLAHRYNNKKLTDSELLDIAG